MTTQAIVCPICGAAGSVLRQKAAADLIREYERYHRMPISPALATKYFLGPVAERWCSGCDLRWYDPCRLGEGDFYAHLGSFPSYYAPMSWDKVAALEMVKQLRPESVVDVGCGDGWLIRQLQKEGFVVCGTEINEAEIRSLNAENFSVYSPEAAVRAGLRASMMVSLQTLEHVPSPSEWLTEQVGYFKPSTVLLAVPAHDTMLGYTSDPLVWPPHHATLWSGRALERLAIRCGWRVERLLYQTNDWARFDSLLEREPGRRLWGKLPFPRGATGRFLFRCLRRAQVSWVARAHTVLVVLRQSTP